MDRKIKVFSQVVYIISRIVRIFTLIGACCVLTGGLILMALPSNIFSLHVSADTISAQMDFDGLLTESQAQEAADQINESSGNGFYVSADGTTLCLNFGQSLGDGITVNTRSIASMLTLLALNMGCLYVLLLFGGKVLCVLKTADTPFCELAYRKLVTFGYVLLGYALLSAMLSGLTGGILQGRFNLSFGPILTYAMLAFCYLILLGVFRKGILLQNQIALAPEENAEPSQNTPEA